MQHKFLYREKFENMKNEPSNTHMPYTLWKKDY